MNTRKKENNADGKRIQVKEVVKQEGISCIYGRDSNESEPF